MMCARCRELEEENRQLKRDLGYDVERRHILLFVRSLGVTPQQARLLSVLYRRPGQLVTYDTLVEAMATNSLIPRRLVQVHLHGLRKRLGGPFTETTEGLGVRLTKRGVQIIKSAMEGEPRAAA